MGNVQRSGMTEENMGELVMNLYCKKAGKELEDGSYQLAKPFKFIEASNFLSDHPKFGGKSEEEENKVINRLVVNPNVNENTVDNTHNVGSDETAASLLGSEIDSDIQKEIAPTDFGSEVDKEIKARPYKRPKGIRSKKRDEINDLRKQKNGASIVEMTGAMNRTNVVLEKMAFGQEVERKNDHDYMILQLLSKNSVQYKNILSELIARRTDVVAHENDVVNGEITDEEVVGGASGEVE